MFQSKKESFPKKEENILNFWQENKVFEQAGVKNKKLFSFYDGPPFATGLPHYGHLLAGTIKDVIPRYKTMKGFYVSRRFGWDCHGLPVENEIEKEEQLYGAKSIESFGIARFNTLCKDIVLRYTKEWEKTVNRMGRWVDFKNTYRTMDFSFMESVFWVFSELYKKGLVYQGFKVMPYSTKLGTPLSNFEANLNYKEVDDPSLVVAFKSVDEPNTFFLAWTTTPWTLISNLALTVGPKIDYVKIKDKKSQKIYYIALERKDAYIPHEDQEILATMRGQDLIGKKYEPLFDFFEKRKIDSFRVIGADFVTLDEGTGIVHTAPAFGEDDFYACQKENIGIVCPIDQNGLFTEEVPPVVGKHVKEVDPWVISELKVKQALFHLGRIRHRYPFCWRSDTPLIYRAVETWFVAVEKIKDRLIAANQKIFWVPGHIKDGRFGKWLENARDWAISRNRYWGTPLPIWQSEDKSEIIVFGSVKDLEKKTKKKITDLHRQYLDDLTFTHHKKVFKRVPEVFDCWFESGAMPYAQSHYPFENKKLVKKSFPADFIAEGLDQTRGWFYTLNVLSTALFDQPAFKNVIVNGIILAADGNKMSKRLKNYPDPEEVIEKYGADAIRLYMLHSPAVTAEDFRFSCEGVESVTRQVLLPFWNSYVFLATYAQIYHFDPSTISLPKKPQNSLDQWILSLLQQLIVSMEKELEAYELSKALDPLFSFIEQLTNWYIRRGRTRFWQDEATLDRNEAFATLYHVLKTLCKVAAPFIPFLSEAIFQELRVANDAISVHLESWPKVEKFRRKEQLEAEMDVVQRAVTMGHALRKEHRLKVRQPLAKAHLVAASPEILKIFIRQKNLIMEELNVKELEFHEEEGKFIQLTAKPNFPVLGKKIGKLLPQVHKRLLEWSQDEMKEFLKNKKATLYLDHETVELGAEDLFIERKVLENIAAQTDEKIAVALDTKLTEELILEGIAREIVNKINLMRKEKDFFVTDRIHVVMQKMPLIEKSVEQYRAFIQNEILARSIIFEDNIGEEIEINEEKTHILITKA